MYIFVDIERAGSVSLPRNPVTMNPTNQHDGAADGAANSPDEPSLLLDDAQQSRLCSLVAVGMAATTAAELVAGDAEALEQTTAADPRFAARVRQAAAQHEAALLATVSEAARSPKQWRAAVWLLERTRPDTYGRGRANTISQTQFDKVLRSFVKGLFDCVDDPESKRRMARFICQEGLELDRDSSSPAAVPASPAEPTSPGKASAHGRERPPRRSASAAEQPTSPAESNAHCRERPPWRSGSASKRKRPRAASRSQYVPDRQPHVPSQPPPRHEPARGQQRPVGSALRGVP